MVFRWIVNAGLLAIPIGTTIGVLVGIDAQRQASGQQPLFSGGDNGSSTGGNGGLGNGGGGGGNGGGGGTTDDNGIQWNEYCQDAYGIEPTTKGQQYILNPNQWGVTAATVGGLCMNVTTFNNGTYATNTTGPEFAVTWNYTLENPNQPVHAFPNIMVEGDTLPVRLKDLEKVHMDVEWTYGVGEDPSPTTDESTLDAEALNANVAIDIFLDSIEATSSNSSTANFEIMIWFAKFGTSTDPIGYDATLPQNGMITTRNVNGTDFELYYGQNGQKQNVITYIASKTTGTFNGDLQELLTRPSALPEASAFPADTDYLGHFSFGSEAFYSKKNVTFHVPTFSIDMRT